MMTIKIHEDGIDRNAKPAEITQIEANQIAEQQFIEQREAEAAAKAVAKTALLDRLGITADEAKLLLS